jgi:hypothetical protein
MKVEQENQKDVHTKGNVIVNKIKVGDIHYEYDMGLEMEFEVLTKPVRSDEGQWTWKAKNTTDGKEVSFLVTEGFSHYAPNLYDCQAYGGCKRL